MAHCAVLRGAYDQMPMVRHQLDAEQLHVAAREPFFRNALKGFVIGLFAKDARPPVAAIQGMVDAVGFVGARRSGHDEILLDMAWTIKQ
jgi:hypothetical protein